MPKQSKGIPQLNGKFKPNNDLLGRPTKVWDNDTGTTLLLEGTLSAIKGPHLFEVNGQPVEVDATYDFSVEDDGSITIFGWL